MSTADRVVDLRSDFLSRPTDAMIEAMGRAARESSAFGLREDKHVKALESEVATLLGKEDALFCPTCTQANQIAINIHCQPGEAVAAEASSHVFTSEAGALAALSGVMARPVPGADGRMDQAVLSEVLGPADALRARVALVVLENTHVRTGGRVMPLERMRAQSAIAARAGAAVHLDGARLANAAVALNVDMSELASVAQSVALSLNKGLGAPLGAVLAGSRGFIDKALEIRQRFGGGWRPAGIPASAALLAIRDWQSRIFDDHSRAKLLAKQLADIPGVAVDAPVDSNLVIASMVGYSAAELALELEHHAVKVLAFTATGVRMALYNDIADSDVSRVIDAFTRICEGAGPQ